MPDKTADYASYLLCVWLGNEEGNPVWRASLESTRDPERRNFTNLGELIVYLQNRFGDPQDNHKDEKEQPTKKEDPCQ
jgi:hypothetical protein